MTIINAYRRYLLAFLLTTILVIACLVIKDYVPAAYATALAVTGRIALVAAAILGIRALILAGIVRRQGGDR